MLKAVLNKRTFVFRNVMNIFTRKICAKVKVNNLNIHYEKVGNGPKTVLLLPGALGTARLDFGPQLDNLDGNKFTLIGWDPPGYGKSRPPERNFNDFYQKDASLAAKMMVNLGIPKYSILGWSDGGMTGIIVSANNPNNVDKLAIWGSKAYISEKDRNNAIKIIDTSKWSASAREPLEAVYGVEGLKTMSTNFVESYCKYSEICKDEVQRLKCPTFVLHGDKDFITAAEHVDYFSSNIRNVRIHRWPEGKHNVHLKYSKEFNQLIEKFLLE